MMDDVPGSPVQGRHLGVLLTQVDRGDLSHRLGLKRVELERYPAHFVARHSISWHKTKKTSTVPLAPRSVSRSPCFKTIVRSPCASACAGRGSSRTVAPSRDALMLTVACSRRCGG